MGVTEDRKKRRLNDEKRLDSIIARQLEIERIWKESTFNMVALFEEHNNLSYEREILEKRIAGKII